MLDMITPKAKVIPGKKENLSTVRNTKYDLESGISNLFFSQFSTQLCLPTDIHL